MKSIIKDAIASPRVAHARRAQSPGGRPFRDTSPLLLLACLSTAAAGLWLLSVRAPTAPTASEAVLAPAVRPATVSADALAATPSFPIPLLTTLELLTLQTYARNTPLYVEWGSGASTSLVAPMAQRAVSIDNNAEWCAKVEARPDVAWWRAQAGVLRLVCVDTVPTGAFGAPAAGADQTSFAAYSRAIDAVVADEKAATPRRALASSAHPVTLAFVDGRFRVACALRALKHVAPGRGVVAVHDWERAAYGAMLGAFYDVVEVAGRLAVLTPKRAWDEGAWAAAVAVAEVDPA